MKEHGAPRLPICLHNITPEMKLSNTPLSTTTCAVNVLTIYRESSVNEHCAPRLPINRWGQRQSHERRMKWVVLLVYWSTDEGESDHLSGDLKGAPCSSSTNQKHVFTSVSYGKWVEPRSSFINTTCAHNVYGGWSEHCASSTNQMKRAITWAEDKVSTAQHKAGRVSRHILVWEENCRYSSLIGLVSLDQLEQPQKICPWW